MISTGRVDSEGHLADEVYTGGEAIKRSSSQESSSVPLTWIHTYGEIVKYRARKIAWHIVEGLEHLAEEFVLSSLGNGKLMKNFEQKYCRD